MKGKSHYPSQASKVAVFVDFLAELLAENGRLIYSPEWRLYAPVSESNTATRRLPKPSVTPNAHNTRTAPGASNRIGTHGAG
jgi:hypothetical protein